MQNDKKKRRSFLKHILAGSAVLAGTAAAIKTGEGRNPQADRLTQARFFITKVRRLKNTTILFADYNFTLASEKEA